MIDATGAAPREDVSVAIAGDRITSIQKEIQAPRGANVIDATGKFLIPGLWDMHVHLNAPQFLPLLVANGITGVREMYSGIPLSTIAAWRSLADSPRIVASGFLDGPLLRLAGDPPPGAFAVGNAAEARVAVRTLAASGVDFLKVYNDLPRDAYFAIAAEAKVMGIPFAGHVPEAVSPLEASEAGQLSQEHLINILLACSTNEEELRAARIALMNDPTISGQERALRMGFPETEGLFDTYSEEKAATMFKTFVKNGTWHTPTLALVKYFADTTDGALQVRARALLERHKKLVADMHRAGVEFLAGTDLNATNPVPAGIGLHEELALFVESGFTPMEALQTATRNPARYFGKLDQMGTVEVGKAADLVLLAADPLKDIRNTRKVAAVVMRGRYFSRAALDAMAASAGN